MCPGSGTRHLVWRGGEEGEERGKRGGEKEGGRELKSVPSLPPSKLRHNWNPLKIPPSLRRLACSSARDLLQCLLQPLSSLHWLQNSETFFVGVTDSASQMCPGSPRNNAIWCGEQASGRRRRERDELFGDAERLRGFSKCR